MSPRYDTTEHNLMCDYKKLKKKFAFILQIKVNEKQYFMPDVDAKSYAFHVDKKLKYFHIHTVEHGVIFFVLKVDITPLGTDESLNFTSIHSKLTFLQKNRANRLNCHLHDYERTLKE